jgi:hypothetical protein
MLHRHSWHAVYIPNTGTRVYDVCDRKHEARLEAVLMSNEAVIRFYDTGWKCTIPLTNLRKVPRNEIEV